MNKPQRIALTAAIGAAALPTATAIAMAIQGPINALAWQLSYVAPASLLGSITFFATGLALACFAAAVAFVITRIWSKQP
jgi:hypothetical protein